MLSDPRLKPFFDDVNMMRLVIKQVQFLSFAFRGQREYKGRDLRDVHYHLIKDKGLNLEHFDLTCQHFKETLVELALPEADIHEAMGTLAAVRDSFDPKTYVNFKPSRGSNNANILHDPTSINTLSDMIPASQAERDLLQKTGSKGVVMAAVRVFYMRVMNDNNLRHFFEDIDLHRLKNKLVSFLAYAFTGGRGHQVVQPQFMGLDIAFFHAHMVDRGLNMKHFDAVVQHFCLTLKQLNVPQGTVDEASANLMMTRNSFAHVIERSRKNTRIAQHVTEEGYPKPCAAEVAA
jgi:hemoglobin